MTTLMYPYVRGVLPPLGDHEKRLVLMSYNARRAYALQWYLCGFAESGRGFHGELYDAVRCPALGSLLEARFGRLWLGG